MANKKPRINPRRIKLNPVGVDKAQQIGQGTGFTIKGYASYAEMVATQICKVYGSVTVDDVRAVLLYYDIPLVGGRWHSFFKRKNFKWDNVGVMPSRRQVAKGRTVIVWVRT